MVYCLVLKSERVKGDCGKKIVAPDMFPGLKIYKKNAFAHPLAGFGGLFAAAKKEMDGGE